MITKYQFPKTEISINYPTSHRTYSEKSGGKLDKLQNYISNKNGK